MKIMIVEDELWIRNAIVEMIGTMGQPYEVIAEVANGEEAWGMIWDLWPTVLITDIIMPMMNGLELARRIHEQKLPIVSIIISGFDDFQYAKQAISCAVKEYLLKPVQPDELKQALNRASDQLMYFQHVHEPILRIQSFMEQMEEMEFQVLRTQWENLLHSILRLKSTHPEARACALQVLKMKMFEKLLVLQADPGKIENYSGTKDDESIRSYHQELLEQWILHFNQESISHSRSILNKACKFIETHFTEELSLTDMAEYCHLSISRFSLLFKQQTGVTLTQYVNKCRIQKAKQLLFQTDRKISDIADEAGFSGLSYFNRVFKNEIRLSPKEYRERMDV